MMAMMIGKKESFGLFDINGTNRRRKVNFNIIEDHEFDFSERQKAFENHLKNQIKRKFTSVRNRTTLAKTDPQEMLQVKNF